MIKCFLFWLWNASIVCCMHLNVLNVLIEIWPVNTLALTILVWNWDVHCAAVWYRLVFMEWLHGCTYGEVNGLEFWSLGFLCTKLDFSCMVFMEQLLLPWCGWTGEFGVSVFNVLGKCWAFLLHCLFFSVGMVPLSWLNLQQFCQMRVVQTHICYKPSTFDHVLVRLIGCHWLGFRLWIPYNMVLTIVLDASCCPTLSSTSQCSTLYPTILLYI